MKDNEPCFTRQNRNKLNGSHSLKIPACSSFAEFLERNARVPGGRGLHGPYSFTGREALRAVVDVIDKIFSEKLADAEVSLAGGAQFGKTILELNLAAYCTAQQFRNFGLYLPDDDLVEGIVDSKFRPDVVDQIGWFAEMVQVGKALNKSGKAVNRKGAFLVTDGERKSVGMIRGLGKVPTTFSMDVAAMDELDDIEPKMMKFVRGRLTASDLRFVLKIGTQRVHGRGMNKAWKDGSRGVFVFRCPNCGRLHNAEEEFPQIIRLRPIPNAEGRRQKEESAKNPAGGSQRSLQRNCQEPESGASFLPLLAKRGVGWGEEPKGSQGWQLSETPHEIDSPPCALSTPSPPLRGGEGAGDRFAPDSPVQEATILPSAKDQRLLTSSPTDPQLTWAGDFKLPGSDVPVAAHNPSHQYYLGCVDCGAELDRSQSIEQHRAPELIKQRKWSFRISQLAIGAIDLSQIVSRFQSAVADAEEMIVFRCDVLGLPQSTSQALTPVTLDRARSVESFDLAPRVRDGRAGFGGLDMGDRCWFFARDVDGKSQTRHLLAADCLNAGDVVASAISRFHTLGLSALFIDERPLVNEARSIALALNGLQQFNHWPRIANERDAYVTLPGGLTWDGKNARWLNLKCAVVRFTKNKLGAGIEQGIAFFEEGGQTKFVPLISCNRFESIDRVVREFLTPTEGVVEVINGKVRETPALLLPRLTPGHPPILDVVDAHLITGSEREKENDGSLGDYVDGCENHFLLADGYSKLAEIICEKSKSPPFAFTSVNSKSSFASLPSNILGRGKPPSLKGIFG